MNIIKFLIAISVINAVALVVLVTLGTKPNIPASTVANIIVSPVPSAVAEQTIAPVVTKAPAPKPAATKKPIAATPKPTATAIANIATNLQATATPAPTTSTVANTPAPTAAPATPTPAPGCVIVIDGARYDVTQFRNQHSGGNIFQCGTDMSAVFWSRHNASILSRMAPYKI